MTIPYHAPPSIHAHPHPATTLIPRLQSHLPHSLPLLRRIQHELIYPSSTAVVLSTLDPTRSRPLENQNEEEPWLAAHADLFRGRETQVVIYSSLEHYEPQTRRIPYTSSSEIPPTFLAELTTSSAEKKALLRAQLVALLRYVKTALLPLYLDKYPCGVYGFQHPGKVPPPPPNAFLVGSLCTGVLGALRPDTLGYHHGGLGKDEDEESEKGDGGVRIHRLDSGHGKFVFSREMYSSPPPPPSSSPAEANGGGAWMGDGDEVKIHRLYSGHGKYIFDRERYSSSSSSETGNCTSNGLGSVSSPMAATEQPHPLPPNYRYKNIPPTFNFDLVRSRTAIFRSDETLSRMGGVAIYHRPAQGESSSSSSETRVGGSDDKPIGWAFISVDGSLATLHIEPAHRGKGLAVQLGKETMRRAMSMSSETEDSGVFHDSVRREPEGFMHADVKLDNAASRRVMEKIGGVVRWTDAWVVLEVI